MLVNGFYKRVEHLECLQIWIVVLASFHGVNIPNQRAEFLTLGKFVL